MIYYLVFCTVSCLLRGCVLRELLDFLFLIEKLTSEPYSVLKPTQTQKVQ